jgi:hypothetical protein
VEKRAAVTTPAKRAFIEEFAALGPEEIETVFALRRIGFIKTILFVVTAENQITILVGERVVAVLTVLALLIDDPKARNTREEFADLVAERPIGSVGEPEVQCIPPIAKETRRTVDRKRHICWIHRYHTVLT